MFTWRFAKTLVATRKFTDAVNVSLSFATSSEIGDFHVQRKAKTLLIYVFIFILFLYYYSVLLIFIVSFSDCKDTKNNSCGKNIFEISMVVKLYRARYKWVFGG